MRWPIERSCTVPVGKDGVGGSMASVCAGLSTVLFGDVIVDVGIHWPSNGPNTADLPYLEIYRSDLRYKHRSCTGDKPSLMAWTLSMPTFASLKAQ